MPPRDTMIDIEQPPVIEKALLARLVLPGDDPAAVDESLAEMKRLAWTAGADVAVTVTQNRPRPDPGTLFGKGKIADMKAACDEAGAATVIVDTDLTPTQGANLEDALDRKVVDRTQLVLDIFAQRARTNEAKLQVELAQLRYILPRLTGRGSLMRQQGGIGVRGPGEQKLEVDRRVIRTRIQRLEREIEAIRQARQVQRKRRAATGIATVALVGYTNAGKSSLLNALTRAGAFVEDKLFATLDPTTRRCPLPGGRDALFSDTVGFVRDLPHALVAAFRATLEEVKEADALLLVADASHPAVHEHVRAVFTVLDEIEAQNVPMLVALNKVDAAEPGVVGQLSRTWTPSVPISAKTGEGLDRLLEAVDDLLGIGARRVRLRIPQREAALVSRVHETGRVLDQRYEGNDVLLDAEVEPALAAQVDAYIEPAG